MAAPGRRTQLNGSDSSSSDDEQRERIKEAAWLHPGVEQSVQPQKDLVAPVIPSLRAQPDNHEHDGNELQTTPEFRAHVAKKLAAMLDSSIKEIPKSCKKTPKAESEEEDEGFRLFSTSVPGDTGTTTPCLLPKRRVTNSSSEDSEEENERCREAAVSGFDILKHSALPPVTVETLDAPSNEQITKKLKKKKKKKKDVGEGTALEQQEVMQDYVANGFKKNKHLRDEDASNQQPNQPNSFKKKKQKRLEEVTELECQDLQQLCGTKKKLKKCKHLGDEPR